MKDNLRDARERLKQAKKEKASKKNISDIENELKNIQQAQKDNKAAKKEAEKALAELHKRIDLEAKPVLKKKFDYLNEKELRAMGQIVSGYLDFAERQAERQQTMTMKDWAMHLDKILNLRLEI